MSAISYTPSIISQSLVQNLNLDQSQQTILEEELSSGALVNQPSDNPVAAQQIVGLNDSIATAGQYVNNANDGSAWLSLGTSTLNSVLSSLQSMQSQIEALSGESLSNQQAAATGTVASLQSTLAELTSLANTSYNGQAIFAGTGGSPGVTGSLQAFDTSTGAYWGGSVAVTRSVAPGVSVTVSVTGTSVFGTGAAGLLSTNGVLNQLITDINSGNMTAATTTDLGGLQSAITTVESQAAVLGANYQRMQNFSAQATSTETALQTQLTNVDSVNVAQAVTQLTQEQQTYQTGLWATAQIESHSLVNYL